MMSKKPVLDIRQSTERDRRDIAGYESESANILSLTDGSDAEKNPKSIMSVTADTADSTVQSR